MADPVGDGLGADVADYVVELSPGHARFSPKFPSHPNSKLSMLLTIIAEG